MSEITKSLEMSLKEVLEMKNPERTFTHDEVKYLAGLKIFEFKGYISTIEYDGSNNILYGHIDKISDLVCYQGATLSEFEEAFYRSVDEYIEFCAEIGKKAERPV